MPAAIRAENLRKTFRVETKGSGFSGRLKSLFSPSYRTVDAVAGISLSVPRGQKVAFLGPNGAGKSTFIRMLTGILAPTSGDLEVCGLDPRKDRSKLAYRVGAVFGQTSRLWYHLAARDTLLLLAAMYRIPAAEAKARVAELAGAFGVADLLDQPVRKLSLGQRMRCEAVASLLHKPEVLFLDEPTIGLDMVAKDALRDAVNRLAARDGTTVFLTSHDMGDVEGVCDRVVVINRGAAVFDGTLDGLRRDHVKVKSVRARFAPDAAFTPSAGMEMESFAGGRLAAKIPANPDALRAAVASLASAEDFTFEDPSLEEIIRTFY